MMKLDILSKINTSNNRKSDTYDEKLINYLSENDEIITMSLQDEDIELDMYDLERRSEHELYKHKIHAKPELFWSKQCGEIYDYIKLTENMSCNIQTLDQKFRDLNIAARKFVDRTYDIGDTTKMSFREISSISGWNRNVFGYTHLIDMNPSIAQKNVLESYSKSWTKAYNILSKVVYDNYLEFSTVKLRDDREIQVHSLTIGDWELRDRYIISPTTEQEQKISTKIRKLLPGALYQEISTRLMANYTSSISNGHKNFNMLVMDENKKAFNIHADGCFIRNNTLVLMPRDKRWKNYDCSGKIGINLDYYDINKIGIVGQRISKQIFKTSSGKWKLGIFIKANVCPNTSKHIAAFDPGVKKFMVISDTNGYVYEVNDPFEKMITKLQQMNNVKDKFCETNIDHDPKKFKKLTKNIKKLQDKIRRQVDDYHCKLAKFLAIKYHGIIAPELSRFISKCKGVTKVEANNLRRLIMRHGNFSYRLRNACNTYGCKYLFTNEDYTSKTCGSCGRHDDGRSSVHLDQDTRILTCVCGNTVDRDINGAKNILCRFISK